MNSTQEELDFEAGGDESGYQQWQKENAAQTPPPQTSPRELNFAAENDETGYRQWQAERAAAKLAFERTWNLRLGCQVRVEVTSLSKSLVGKITLSPNNSKHLKPTKEPLLKIGTFEFLPSEITSLVVLDAPS